MSGKKAGVPVGDIFGAIILFVLFFLMLMLFSACNAIRDQQKSESLEFSKDEVLASRNLNIFLERPDSTQTVFLDITENQKVSDTLLDHLLEFVLDDAGLQDTGIDLAEQNKFKSQVSDLSKDFIYMPSRFMVILPSGGMIYDSFNNYAWRDISYEGSREGTAMLPVPIEENKFIFMEIVMQR